MKFCTGKQPWRGLRVNGNVCEEEQRFQVTQLVKESVEASLVRNLPALPSKAGC